MRTLRRAEKKKFGAKYEKGNRGDRKGEERDGRKKVRKEDREVYKGRRTSTRRYIRFCCLKLSALILSVIEKKPRRSDVSRDGYGKGFPFFFFSSPSRTEKIQLEEIKSRLLSLYQCSSPLAPCVLDPVGIIDLRSRQKEGEY